MTVSTMIARLCIWIRKTIFHSLILHSSCRAFIFSQMLRHAYRRASSTTLLMPLSTVFHFTKRQADCRHLHSLSSSVILRQKSAFSIGTDCLIDFGRLFEKPFRQNGGFPPFLILFFPRIFSKNFSTWDRYSSDELIA